MTCIFQALEDESPNVRRHVVQLILQYKPKSVIELLKKVLDDGDSETRFYAGVALKLIEKDDVF